MPTGPVPCALPAASSSPVEAGRRRLRSACSMNNLDPDVAEDPDRPRRLRGHGRAARSWEAFDAIVATLRSAGRRRDAARAVGQAGRRLPHPRPGAARPDRELEPRAAVGDWDTFRRLEAEGLTMYGQMTAGSLDLHRHPGHRAGHLRDVRCRRARPLRRRSLRGRFVLTAGWAGWRRPAARGRDERRRRLIVDVDAAPPRSPHPRRATSDLARARPRQRAARDRGGAGAGDGRSVGLVGDCGRGASRS